MSRFGNASLPVVETVEERIHDGGPAGVGQDLAPDSDEPPGRHAELEAHSSRAVIHHVRENPLADAELLDHHALEGFRDVDQEDLEGLLLHSVDFFHDHFGVRERELVALAAHGLDEDRELELAAAENAEGVRGVGVLEL